MGRPKKKPGSHKRCATLSFTPAVIAEAEAMAYEAGVSLSQFVDAVLADHLARVRQRRGTAPADPRDRLMPPPSDLILAATEVKGQIPD